MQYYFLSGRICPIAYRNKNIDRNVAHSVVIPIGNILPINENGTRENGTHGRLVGARAPQGSRPGVVKAIVKAILKGSKVKRTGSKVGL